MRDALYPVALYSQLDLLKRHAKVLKHSRELTHTQALDALAISLSYRDWQHLLYETQQAWGDHLLNIPLDSDLHQLDLQTLCRKRPDLITPVTEELTLDLFQDLVATLLTKKRYAARAVDGGENNAIFDDKNVAGWRLCVDEPGGYVFFGQYPARGRLIAFIDASVPDEVIQEFTSDDRANDEDWELARVEAREHDRQMDVAEVVLNHMRLPNPMSAPRQLMEACYEAIRDSLVLQCGIAMTSGTDDLANKTGPANLSSQFIL